MIIRLGIFILNNNRVAKIILDNINFSKTPKSNQETFSDFRHEANVQHQELFLRLIQGNGF